MLCLFLLRCVHFNSIVMLWARKRRVIFVQTSPALASSVFNSLFYGMKWVSIMKREHSLEIPKQGAIDANTNANIKFSLLLVVFFFLSFIYVFRLLAVSHIRRMRHAKHTQAHSLEMKWIYGIVNIGGRRLTLNIIASFVQPIVVHTHTRAPNAKTNVEILSNVWRTEGERWRLKKKRKDNTFTHLRQCLQNRENRIYWTFSCRFRVELEAFALQLAVWMLAFGSH